MIKLCVSDLDGTLLRNKAESLSAQQTDLIKRLLDKNIAFSVASGRTRHELKMILKDLYEDIYLISDDGALCTKGSDVIYESPVSVHTAKRFTDILNRKIEKRITVSAKNASYIYSDDASFKEKMFEKYKGFLFEASSLSSITENIYKISIYVGDTYPDRKQYEFMSAYGLRLVYDRCGWLEFICASCSKATSVAALQRKLGVSPYSTVCIGDNINDITMMSKAKFSMAVKNASDKLKAKAAYKVPDAEYVFRQILDGNIK